MAAHRFWRLAGFGLAAAGNLELSEVVPLSGGAAADPSNAAAFAATMAPASGSVADLRDGSTLAAVTWPPSAWSAPGFALVWDFGAGATGSIDGIRLGSGASADTFPLDVRLAYSDAGDVWTVARAAPDIVYPGAFALTDTPTVGSDADASFAQVQLLAHFDGAEGSTPVDSSGINRALTVSGSATVTTGQSKFGGTSLSLTGGYVSAAASADFAFPADFTIEFFARKSGNGPAGYDTALSTDTSNGSAVNGWFVELASNRGLQLWAAGTNLVSYATNPNDSQWHHWAIARQGSTVRAFRDGALVATSTSSLSIPANGQFGIGGSVNSTQYRYSGHIDEVRITKGVARYTADFDPPTAAFYDGSGAGELIPRNPTPPQRWPRVLAALFSPGAQEPTAAVRALRTLETLVDVYHGGRGRVYGTVKEKNTPANTPLRRRVLLVDERAQIVVRETWSDASTGNFEFSGVRLDMPFTVIALDHPHNYRAVIADNQLAEALP